MYILKSAVKAVHCINIPLRDPTKRINTIAQISEKTPGNEGIPEGMYPYLPTTRRSALNSDLRRSSPGCWHRSSSGRAQRLAHRSLQRSCEPTIGAPGFPYLP